MSNISLVRILVVTKNNILSRILEEILGEAGYEIQTCTNTHDAIVIINGEQKPHLVLTWLGIVAQILYSASNIYDLPVLSFSCPETKPFEARFYGNILWLPYGKINELLLLARIKNLLAG